MWEAFLLQMNDFDLFLEQELREMLDPIVAHRPPRRRGRQSRIEVVLALEPAPVELAVETIPVNASAPRLLP